MRIEPFLRVARLARKYNMPEVLKGIEYDLLAAFRESTQLKDYQKYVIYTDKHSGTISRFPVPTKEIMKLMPSHKLEAVRDYRKLVGCDLLAAKRIIEDYAYYLGIHPVYSTHTPSDCCKFD